MGMYTELTKNGKVKTDLTDLICPAWRKYGKQPNPQQKDPNVASFFMNVTLIDGSLYISCNETGAKKKYISFYIPGDSITTFCQRLGSFIQELAKEGTASALFPYKNKVFHLSYDYNQLQYHIYLLMFHHYLYYIKLLLLLLVLHLQQVL